MFDTSQIWALVLKKLRENNESVLLAVCSDLDLEFTSNDIIITAHNETVFAMLKKHLPTLNKYAGGDYIQVHKPAKKNNETIRKLKELFGEKLTVE